MNKALLLALLLVPLTRADEKPAAPHETPSSAQTVRAVRNVDVAQFEKLRPLTNHVVLDVRTPAEFEAGHIPGAINVDFRAKDFAQKIAALDRSQTYLVHCAVGGRSASASAKMVEAQLPNVVNLLGGMKAWEKAGHAPATGK
jgi:rhodanese-related sulfurtransferase